MNEIYLTSDTHFSHKPEFLWGPRGFSSAKEMNEIIVEKWNSIVKSDDIIYHLGDMALTDTVDAITYIKKLNGFIWWIRGNHDSRSKVEEITKECKNISLISNPEASWATMFKYNNKITCYLSHYPTLTANYDEKHFNQHVIALHGHTHQQANFLYPNNPFCYHVGMDSHDCKPVNIEEIIGEVRQRWFDLQSLKIPVEDLYVYPMKGE